MSGKLPEDSWVWGKEKIIWGFDPQHKYTLKILEPRPGREGCLSLQYHDEKSESWVCLRGSAWILLVVDGKVCTRILHPGDIQNVPQGILHRITAIEPGTQILEPSTPDRHTANKQVPKDVVRLHCYHGRPVSQARDNAEKALVSEAVMASDKAMADIAAGEAPAELNVQILSKHGAFTI
ncbi:MAG: hypothetical protein K1X79_02645 [Oligoflexia bacterium]|nr:hypothetical protein [Oligoflexia bacterium]